MTVSYWIFSATVIVQQVVGNLFKEFSDSPVNDIIYTNSPITEALNYLQYAPLLLFVLLGALFLLKDKREKNIVKTFCLTGFLLSALAFPGPSLLLEKVARDLQIGRIGEYAFLFISIAGAVGMLILYRRTKKLGQYLIVILFASMCLLAVSNDFVASDNPLVKRPFYTYYLTEDETTGFDFVANVTNGYVMADYVTDRYYYASKSRQKGNILETDSNATTLIRHSADDVFLIRQNELTKRPLQICVSPTGKFVPDEKISSYRYIYNTSRIWSTTSRYNKIFETEDIAAFN
jgi:hypothetical protein